MAIDLQRLQEAAHQRRRFLLIGSIIFIVGLAIWGIAESRFNAKAEKARAALRSAILSGETSKIELVIQTYPSSRSALDAMMELGKRAAEAGQWPQAEQWYQKAEQAARSTMDRGLAGLAYGLTLVSNQKYQEAAAQFEKVAALKDPSSQGEALWRLAKVQGLLQQFDAAQKTHERIQKELPNSEYASRAKAS